MYPSNHKKSPQDHFHNDTSLSFDSIQTPGWTSLVATEQSKSSHTIKNHPILARTPHNQILTRLNSLPKLKNQEEVQFSNIRAVPSSVKNKNIFVYGSIKEQKKQIETPKSKPKQTPLKNSKPFSIYSNQKSQSSNRVQKTNQRNKMGQSGKLSGFFSMGKGRQSNFREDSKKRISSARSESSLRLKDQIKERLSVGNYVAKNVTSEFESNIKTEPHERGDGMNFTAKETGRFYGQIHSMKPVREDKYMKRYLQKLNHRSNTRNTIKVFKKQTINEEKQVGGKIKSNSKVQNGNGSGIFPCSLKRFNTITIHDHLYQKGLKMEAKKEVARMIDESYERVNTLTFTPVISQKSQQLAESKFTRQSNKSEYGSGFHREECCQRGGKNQYNSKELKGNIFTIEQDGDTKESIGERVQNESLGKLFRILSNGSGQINDRNLQVNIEKLPLALLEILEPLLTEIYKKKRYDETGFIELFSVHGRTGIKSLAHKKQTVVALTDKLFRVLDRNKQKQNRNKQKQNRNQGKQNFIGAYNSNFLLQSFKEK